MRNIINNTFYSRMNLDDFDFSLFRPSASISIPTQLNISEIIIPFAIRGKENTIKLGERIIKDQSELYAENAAENWVLGIWDFEDDEQRRI